MKATLITAAAGALVAVVLWVSIKHLQTENANLKAKNTELAAQIQKQNDAIQAFKAAASLENSEAAGRLANALLKAEMQKAELPQGTGPAVMNEFMGAVFQ